MATITCAHLVKDAKTQAMRPCKVAPVKDSTFCSRHGGKATPAAAPVQAQNSAPKAPVAKTTVAPPAAAVVAGICTAIVKKTNQACTNKAKPGTNLCGMHGPKVKKAIQASADGSGYPTNCKKMTGKNVACQNTAYGPDPSGVASCFRHQGPKKNPNATTTSGGGSTSAPSGPLAGVPLVHLAAVIGAKLLEQLEPDAIAEQENSGYTAQFESVHWMVEFIKLFDERNPSDDEILARLNLLTQTLDGDDFLEKFADDNDQGHSMMHYISEVFGKEHIEWLVNYIRRFSGMSLEGADKLNEFWTQIKGEMGYSDVQAPNPTEVAVAPSAQSSAAKSQYEKIKELAMAKIAKKAEEAAAQKEKKEETKTEEAAGEDELMA